jgi:hypothetical protein
VGVKHNPQYMLAYNPRPVQMIQLTRVGTHGNIFNDFKDIKGGGGMLKIYGA